MERNIYVFKILLLMGNNGTRKLTSLITNLLRYRNINQITVQHIQPTHITMTTTPPWS